jgi:hypothetical protein
MRMPLHIIPFHVEYVRKQQKCAQLPSKFADHLPIQTGAKLSRSYTNISARSRFAPVKQQGQSNWPIISAHTTAPSKIRGYPFLCGLSPLYWRHSFVYIGLGDLCRLRYIRVLRPPLFLCPNVESVAAPFTGIQVYRFMFNLCILYRANMFLIDQ